MRPRPTCIIEANEQASQTFAPLEASANLLLALNRYGSARLVVTNARDVQLVVKKVTGRVDAELLKSGIAKRCNVEDWERGIFQVTLVANESSE
jgi:hypothetical protein